MTAAQIVLGIALLLVGAAMILGRRRLAERAQRRGSPMIGVSILWLFLGTLLAMNGVLQLLLAIA